MGAGLTWKSQHGGRAHLEKSTYIITLATPLPPPIIISLVRGASIKEALSTEGTCNCIVLTSDYYLYFSVFIYRYLNMLSWDLKVDPKIYNRPKIKPRNFIGLR